VPSVSEPLPVSADSYPFGAADHQWIPQNVARDDYVEEEFIVSGTANVYSWPAPGPAVVRTPDAPYTTRVLVRRPALAEDFSGNVVVELLNPSNLFDLNIGWALMNREIIHNGDIWVGIAIKPGVDRRPPELRSRALRQPLDGQPAAARRSENLRHPDHRHLE
jgi:Alpha/beta hydrolase domain